MSACSSNLPAGWRDASCLSFDPLHPDLGWTIAEEVPFCEDVSEGEYHLPGPVFAWRLVYWTMTHRPTSAFWRWLQGDGRLRGQICNRLRDLLDPDWRYDL